MLLLEEVAYPCACNLARELRSGRRSFGLLVDRIALENIAYDVCIFRRYIFQREMLAFIRIPPVAADQAVLLLAGERFVLRAALRGSVYSMLMVAT